MQKKIIVLAIASVLAAPAAFADTSNVTLYGKADMSYDFISTGNNAAGVAGVNKGNVSSNVSKFGIKGSEDLGDGLSAVWQIEQQVNMDNSSNSCPAVVIPAGGATVPACNANNGILATRNTFLGLKSNDMGMVLMGRHDTPYKISTRALDIFGDSIADSRSLTGGVSGRTAASSFDGRPTDVIAYISPSFSGFTGAVAYVNLAETNVTAAAPKANALSLAGMYSADPFYASLAFEEHKLDTVVVGGKEKATKVGFGYKMDAFKVNFAYEKTSDNLGALGANKYGHSAYYLAGQYNFTSIDAVKLAYGKVNQIGATANSSANQFSLGYDHNLSKRTKVYAIYTSLKNGAGTNNGFSQSTAAAASNSGFGTSPSVLSLGMSHAF